MGHHGGLDTDDIDLKQVDFSHIPKLVEFIVPFKWHLALALVMTIAVAIMGTFGPLLIRRILDVDIPAGSIEQVTKTALTYLLVIAVIELLRVAQHYMMAWVGQNMLFSMRYRLFSHLQDLGLDFYDRIQAGRIMSRVTSDVEAINDLMTSGILGLVSDLVSLVAIVVIMLRMNTKLALIALTIVPILFIVVWTLRTRMTRAYHKVRRRAADISANLQESISGMRIVQAFSREDVNAERFVETTYRSFEAQMEAEKLRAMFNPIVDMIAALGSALIVYYGGLQMSWGDPAITIGTISAFLNYMTRFFWPIRNLVDMYNVVLQAGVSAERIFEVLETEPNVKDKEGAIELKDIEGQVMSSSRM